MAKRRSRNTTGSGNTRSGRKKGSGRSGDGSSDSLFDAVDPSLVAIPLRQAAQEKYLNYSLSVITSRALPDVRDGLKPLMEEGGELVVRYYWPDLLANPGLDAPGVEAELRGKHDPCPSVRISNLGRE